MEYENYVFLISYNNNIPKHLISFKKKAILILFSLMKNVDPKVESPKLTH